MVEKYVCEPHLAWHRNGISGASFYVVHFKSVLNDKSYIGISFYDAEADEEHDNHGCTAVLLLEDMVHLASGEISVNETSRWRGDVFEPEIRDLIRQHIQEIMESEFY